MEGVRGVMILALEPDPESDFEHFGDSGSGFGSNKNGSRNTYEGVMFLALASVT